MYLLHRTTDGQRWDHLAHIYYGDAGAYERIMAANADVPRHLTLPAGIVIRIPIVQVTSTVTLEAPPWLV